LNGVAGVEGGGKVKEGVGDEVEDGFDVGVGTEIRGGAGVVTVLKPEIGFGDGVLYKVGCSCWVSKLGCSNLVVKVGCNVNSWFPFLNGVKAPHRKRGRCL
jgi:hypothetical protein